MSYEHQLHLTVRFPKDTVEPIPASSPPPARASAEIPELLFLVAPALTDKLSRAVESEPDGPKPSL